jgi:hypothetical protein
MRSRAEIFWKELMGFIIWIQSVWQFQKGNFKKGSHPEPSFSKGIIASGPLPYTILCSLKNTSTSR